MFQLRYSVPKRCCNCSCLIYVLPLCNTETNSKPDSNTIHPAVASPPAAVSQCSSSVSVPVRTGREKSRIEREPRAEGEKEKPSRPKREKERRTEKEDGKCPRTEREAERVSEKERDRGRGKEVEKGKRMEKEKEHRRRSLHRRNQAARTIQTAWRRY